MSTAASPTTRHAPKSCGTATASPCCRDTDSVSETRDPAPWVTSTTANPASTRSEPEPEPEVTARRKYGSAADGRTLRTPRSEEHTSELQSLMRTSYAVFC